MRDEPAWPFREFAYRTSLLRQPVSAPSADEYEDTG